MESKRKAFTCVVIGDWHLAHCTAACLSNVGIKTLLVNPLVNGAAPWTVYPELALSEPGLQKMIAQSRARGLLDFANGVSSAWEADIVWLAIDTPVDDNDNANTAPLSWIAGEVARNGCARRIFTISSQIPIGFSEALEKESGLTVAYVPENLRLGKGIETFFTADRTVIGAGRQDTREEIRKLLKDFQTEFLLCDLATAEMIKHATNTFLATSISFANEMARLGESMGVDNQLVGQALKMDKRIGKQAYVLPGLGFAGGTLPRDLRILQKLGLDRRVPTPLVDAVLTVNQSTAVALVEATRGYCGDLSEKRIMIVGYTYKAETDTLRRSSSLELAAALKREGAIVMGFDPVMNERDLSPLVGLIQHFPAWNDLRAKPDAVIVMTPRRQFADLDWYSLAQLPDSIHTKKPTLVLDAHSIISRERVLDAGLTFKALWQPVCHP